ncbi:MAG: hypothetical protein N2449_03920 [Bacteroidales bacterium]|nr:hypothetical protein [Bacteroidales bacterium]
MKKFTFLLVTVLFVSALNAQVINGELKTSTSFKGTPLIGATGGYYAEISNGFYAGGYGGLLFRPSGPGMYFQIPIMAEARYYVNGSSDGFYPLANLGFIYYNSRVSSQYVTVSLSGTVFTLALGAGMKTGGVDFSVRYEAMQYSFGSVDNFGFKIGFWTDDGGGRGKKKRRR